MAGIIKRKVKGKEYYYMEISLRIGGKVRKIYEYLGKEKPSKSELAKKKKELEGNALSKYYEKALARFRFSFLSRNEVNEVERAKDNFLSRFEKLNEKQKGELRKNQVVHFVYTTLRTEGVDVDFSDVETAFEIIDKGKKEFTFNNKVIISSSMITGFNYLPKIGINKDGILKLHGIVMSSFERDSPGQLRDGQRIIARFRPSTLKSEEISYRPPPPNLVGKELANFFDWFGKNKDVYPPELAALVHLKLYLIHPFKDGNKRMCRLLFNKVLQDGGYPIINISKDTSEYFAELIKSVESGNEKFFVKFCHKAFLKQVSHRRLK